MPTIAAVTAVRSFLVDAALAFVHSLPKVAPGRAFAAVRPHLPAGLRTRVQRVVRARNGAAHPARADPNLIDEVKQHICSLGSDEISISGSLSTEQVQ